MQQKSNVIHKNFFSFLSKSKITEGECALVKEIWGEKGLQSLEEMLVYYNLLDVNPFVSAISNLLKPFQE